MNDETKKTIKLMGLIYFILLSTIFTVFLLNNVYFQLIQYNLELVSLINVSLITILVLINGAYGYFTWQIVDETRNDRKVTFVERQLEKLYYPLKICLNKNSGIQLTTFGVDDVLNIKKCLYEITPYLYLSSDKLRINLDTFLDIIEMDFVSIQTKYYTEMRSLQKKTHKFNLNDETEMMDQIKSLNEIYDGNQTFFDLFDKYIEYGRINPNEVSRKEIAEKHSELVSLYKNIIETIGEDVLMLEKNLKELLH